MPSMCCGDAAFCQTTSMTCKYGDVASCSGSVVQTGHRACRSGHSDRRRWRRQTAAVRRREPASREDNREKRRR